MNCKPGDLAYTHSLKLFTKMNGKMVDVLCFVQPFMEWTDPNGETHFNDGAAALAVESLGAPFDCSEMGETPTHFGIFSPENLRPIRDNPGEDESFRWAPSPTQKELA